MTSSNKIFLFFLISFLVVGGSRSFSKEPSDVKYITISAFALGEYKPPLKKPENKQKPYVKNGGFLITSNANTQTVGDGLDEFTIWSFDFNKDKDFDEFMKPNGKLISARLTVVLKRFATIDTNQSFYIQGTVKGFEDLPRFRPPAYGSYPNGIWVAVSYDLLHPIRYKPEEITKTLMEKLDGCYPNGYIFDLLLDTKKGDIPMIFRDDAIILFAYLELTKAIPDI